MPGNLQKVHESAAWKNVILKESEWFYVNYVYASQIMKDVFKNYKKYVVGAKVQKNFSKNNFSIDKMNSKFKEMIAEHVIEEVSINLLNQKLKLPKLKRIEA